MRRYGCTVAMIAALALIAPHISPASDGEQAFERGSELLAQGDLEGALTAFAQAARSDGGNQRYAAQFLLLRRVLSLQEAWKLEFDPERRFQMGQALRTFFVDHGLHKRALPIDRETFREKPTGMTAAQLAETHLALKDHDAAAKLLSNLADEQSTPTTRALLGIASARQGNLREARKVADQASTTTPAGPTALYAIARMQAAVGDEQAALGNLGKAFAATPPSRLGRLKTQASLSPEFAGLVTSDGFQKALRTESAVAESSCSSGHSCSGCPSRGACPSGRKE